MEHTVVWNETRDLYNQFIAHPVGSAIMSGNPPRIWYGAWLKALYEIYSAIDASSDIMLMRSLSLYQDYSGFQWEFTLDNLHKSQFYISLLNEPNKINGAICVLSEYCLIHGEDLKPKLINLPSEHLRWFDREGSLECLNRYMIREDLVDSARLCYSFILQILSEIQTKYPL